MCTQPYARNIGGSYSLKSKNVLPTKTEGETSTSGFASFSRRKRTFLRRRKERGEGLFEIQSDLVAIVGNNHEESLVFT